MSLKSSISAGVSKAKSAVSSASSAVKSAVSSAGSAVKSAVSGSSSTPSTPSSGGGLRTSGSSSSGSTVSASSSSGSKSTSSSPAGSVVAGGVTGLVATSGSKSASSTPFTQSSLSLAQYQNDSSAAISELKSGNLQFVSNITTGQSKQSVGLPSLSPTSDLKPVTAYNKLLMGETPTYGDYLAATNITNPDIVSSQNIRMQEKVKNIALNAPNYNTFVAPNTYRKPDGSVVTITSNVKPDKSWVQITPSADRETLGAQSHFSRYTGAVLSSPKEAERLGAVPKAVEVPTYEVAPQSPTRLTGADYRQLQSEAKSIEDARKRDIFGVSASGDLKRPSLPQVVQFWTDPAVLKSAKDQTVYGYKSFKQDIADTIDPYVMPMIESNRVAWAERNPESPVVKIYQQNVEYDTKLRETRPDLFVNEGSKGKSEKLSDISTSASQIFAGAYDAVRDDPVKIAETYVMGVGIGKGAKVGGKIGSKAISYLPNTKVTGYVAGAARATVPITAIGTEVAYWGITDQQAQGKEMSFSGGLPVFTTPFGGETYERWSKEYNERIGKSIATEYIPGELGFRAGFGRNIKLPETDSGKIPLSEQLLRQYEIKKPVDTTKPKLPDVPYKTPANTQFGGYGISKPPSKEMKTMDIFGGEKIKDPEIKNFGRMFGADEMPVGTRQFKDEFSVGYGDFKNRMNEVFIGKDALPLDEYGDLLYGGAKEFWGYGRKIVPEIPRRFTYGDRLREENQYQKENVVIDKYGYPSVNKITYEQDFGNVIKNIFKNSELPAYKNVEDYAYRNREENVFKNMNEHAYRYDYEFLTKAKADLPTPSFKPIILPKLPELKDGKGKDKSKKSKYTIKREEYIFKNPFESNKK